MLVPWPPNDLKWTWILLNVLAMSCTLTFGSQFTLENSESNPQCNWSRSVRQFYFKIKTSLKWLSDHKRSLACDSSLIWNFWLCSRQYFLPLSCSRFILLDFINHSDSFRLIQTHSDSFRLIQTRSDSLRLNQTHSDSLSHIEPHGDTLEGYLGTWPFWLEWEWWEWWWKVIS